jgi:hypothetical protein
MVTLRIIPSEQSIGRFEIPGPFYFFLNKLYILCDFFSPYCLYNSLMKGQIRRSELKKSYLYNLWQLEFVYITTDMITVNDITISVTRFQDGQRVYSNL